MPAHKRYSSSENLVHDDDSPQQHYRRKQSRRERGAEEGGERDDEEVKEEEDPGEDSDGSRSSDDPAKLPEWITLVRPDLRSYVQCPICLGIIKKTRAVMGCLHRFCRECIDKSMRLGNNECPACRTHCASRRSLRDDPRYDHMIETIFSNIEKYEEEELAFHEEEKTRNKEIQASIAQIFRRQNEALLTRRKTSKETASASTAQLPSNCRKPYSRRRNSRGSEPKGSEENEDENSHDGNKDSSSSDEQGTEIKQRKYRRRAGAQPSPSQPSVSAANSDGGGIGIELEASRESKGTSSGPVQNPEVLAWGRGGARSKSVRNTRIMKLTKYLENSKENDDKLDVHLMLISLDKQRMPSLQQLYLCCPPCFSVERLKVYVAHETQLRAEDIEILLVKEHLSMNGVQPTVDLATSIEDKVVLRILEGQETLVGIGDNCASDRNHLILAYRLKEK